MGSDSHENCPMTPGVLEGPDGKKTIRCGTPQAAGGTHPNEPSGATTITTHPMDTITNGGEWNGVSTDNLSIVSDATAPESASNVLQHQYPEGSGGGGNIGGRIVRAGVNNVVSADTLYAHLYAKWSSDFHGHQSGVNKFLYYRVNNPVSGSGDRLYFKAAGKDAGNLELQAIRQNGDLSGADAQREFQRNLGSAGDAVLTRAEWHDIELLCTLNTPGSADGVLEAWLNGTKIMSYSDVQILASGGSGPWEAYNMDQIWGGIGDTTPHTFELWVDHFYGSGV